MFSKVFVSVIVPLTILLPIGTGVVYYSKLKLYAKTIFWYLVISAVVNTIGTILGRGYHINNLPLIHLFTLIEMLLLFYFYRTILDIEKKNKWFNILVGAFVLVNFANMLFFQSIFQYNSYTRTIEAFICILLSLNYFAKLAATETKVVSQPGFFFNAGIFLYFSGAFMLFIFSNLLITKLNTANFLILWNIHAVLFFIMYIFFTIGFVLCRK
ncbi:hypothetical protein [Ferruginibacter profundus]